MLPGSDRHVTATRRTSTTTTTATPTTTRLCDDAAESLLSEESEEVRLDAEDTLGDAATKADERSSSAVVLGGRGQVKEVRGGMVPGLIAKVFHIERHELKKFLYMSFMMFAIIYVFTMTR